MTKREIKIVKRVKNILESLLINRQFPALTAGHCLLDNFYERENLSPISP